MNDSRASNSTFLFPALALVMVGLLGTGFWAGDRWGDGVKRRLRPEPTAAHANDWQLLATTEWPRYEFLRVPLGDSVLLLGGFTGRDVAAIDRVEMLSLVTGVWSSRAPLPVAVTHAPAARVGDSVWIAGGFVGNNPGPVTDRVWRYSLRADAWTEGPSFPAFRGGGVLVSLGDTLHYLGGFAADRNTDSPDHWVLGPSDSAWGARASLPTPRGHLSAAVIDGKIYAVSGNIGHDPIPIDVPVLERYDPARNAWERLRQAPFGLSHTEASTQDYNGWLLVAAGRSHEIGRENNDQVLRYDPSADRWRFVMRTPVPALGGLMVVRQDTMYFGLGAAEKNVATTREVWKRPLRATWQRLDSMPQPLGEVAAGVIGDSLFVVGAGSPFTYIYDLAAGEWIEGGHRSRRPAPGDHHAAEVIGGRLFLFGGIGRQSEGRVQVFDPAIRAWSFRKPMPFTAGSSASALIHGKVYVAGGIEGQHTTAEAAVYDPVADTWRRIAPMPRARNHSAAGTDGTRLFVFGGRGPGSGDRNVVADGFDDVQIYDPTTDRWTVSDGSVGAPAPLPQARGGMGKAVYVNGEFWVIGGETKTGTGASDAQTYARVDIYNPRTNAWRLGPPLSVARHGIFPVEDFGRVLVVGGGRRAGRGESSVFEIIWPN